MISFSGVVRRLGAPGGGFGASILRPRQSDAVMKKASTQVSVFPKFEASQHQGKVEPTCRGIFLWKFAGSSL